MPETRRSGGERTLAALLLLLCAACAGQDSGLRQDCSDQSLTPKPAACGDDLQLRLDDATRATTDLQRIRRSGPGR